MVVHRHIDLIEDAGQLCGAVGVGPHRLGVVVQDLLLQLTRGHCAVGEDPAGSGRGEQPSPAQAVGDEAPQLGALLVLALVLLRGQQPRLDQRGLSGRQPPQQRNKRRQNLFAHPSNPLGDRRQRR